MRQTTLSRWRHYHLTRPLANTRRIQGQAQNWVLNQTIALYINRRIPRRTTMLDNKASPTTSVFTTIEGNTILAGSMATASPVIWHPPERKRDRISRQSLHPHLDLQSSWGSFFIPSFPAEGEGNPRLAETRPFENDVNPLPCATAKALCDTRSLRSLAGDDEKKLGSPGMTRKGGLVRNDVKILARPEWQNGI